MRLHFIGVGGIGMSGLASLCLRRGCVVSGCDAKLNTLMLRLQEQGASISIGHDPTHLSLDADVAIYSSAVSAQEPERLWGETLGIRAVSRGELLAALAAEKRLIAVAGAHGKTTTSGMAAELLIRAGWDPTVLVGGMMLSMGSNVRAGGGAYLVAESDESDGSFLRLSPEIAIVTNIDREHLQHYGQFERLTAAFRQFIDRVPAGGAVISCADDPVSRRTLAHPAGVTYGFQAQADVSACEARLLGHGSRFRARYRGRDLGSFALQVPGRHNVLNALSVISLGLTLELPLETVREALGAFHGTGRRFQVQRLPGDIWCIDDYAHHPAEIEATLAADATTGRRRLVIFQPHRFSRTQALEREFAACFDRADGVIVTDIFAAFERPIPGVSGERLAGLIKAHGHPCVRYVPKRELAGFVTRIARGGDTIFFLGAGDIGELCHDVAGRLHPTGRTPR